MPTTLSNALSKPVIWIIAAVVLAAIDLVAPPRWAICVVHALLLPIAWWLLHRRFVSLLTATLMVAVVVPGLFHIVQQVGTLEESTEGKGSVVMEVIAPARIWTMMSLAASGVFHISLQRARRRRVLLRRDLKNRVRLRTEELQRVNRTLRDEVERRQATQHLLDQSETTFQAIIDRMQLQVLRKNRDGLITYANDMFCSQLGRSPADVIGHLDTEFYPPELAAGYQADDLRVMQTGQSVDHVEEHPTADGQTGFVQVFKAPEYDRDGECVGIQVIFWDVTEKHRGAIALRDSEARKRALFETAGDAVLLVDHQQRIVEANPSAVRLFCSSPADVTNRPLQQIVRAVDPAAAISDEDDPSPRKTTDTIAWGELAKTQRHDLTLIRDDGSQFESETTVHVIPMGRSEGMAIIVRDVTVQRQAIGALRDAKAAAEAASRTKSEFMAGVSHELRTPLGGITGLTDLLSQTPLSPRGHQYVEMIRHSGSLLSDVIEDILDFSAIEAGQVQINPEPIDLHTVVGDSFKSIAARAVGKPIRLSFSISSDTPRNVIADPKRLRQIVMNLGGNAVKFTPEGEVHLRLSPANAAESVEPKEDHFAVCIEVTDTGVGIPIDKQANVFEAFERGEKGTTRRFGGTGLGLSISQGLVERMGGRITLVSEVDVGSTFQCLLQLEPAPGLEKVLTNRPAMPVSVGVVTMPSARMHDSITETLAIHGIAVVPPTTQRTESESAGVLWVVASKCVEQSQLIQRRGGDDVVIWITPLGEEPPQDALPTDPILVEPVLPDELVATIHHPVRKFTAESTATSPVNVMSPIGWTSPINEVGDDRQQASDGLRLLLVDDSKVNRTVIHDQLATAGHRVDVACGGREAVEKACDAKYDCILMDLQMPDMDGTQATIRIREVLRERGDLSPPTIALTAHVTEEHRRQCMDAGMDGFITKPIDRERLLLEIRRHTQHDETPSRQPEDSLLPDEASQPQDTPHSGGVSEMPETPTAEQSWRERMKSHAHSRPKTLVALCDAFLAEVPTLVEQLRAAVEQGDAASLKTSSHTLKSCLAYVAADDDVQRARDIEAHSKEPSVISTEQLDDIDEIAKHWVSYVQTLRDETLREIESGST